MMKRTIVVLGVLVAFLCATFGAYAVENATWGRIKATFSESPIKASGDLSSTQPQFLQRPYRVGKTTGDQVLYGEKLMTVADGGRIPLGDASTGRSAIKVRNNSLVEDGVISMGVPLYGDVMTIITDVTFGPHGTQFLKPTRVKLSYKTADVTGINEEDLVAWYWNEEAGVWEDIGGEVDLVKKQVIFYVDHFSRYGLAPR